MDIEMEQISAGGPAFPKTLIVAPIEFSSGSSGPHRCSGRRGLEREPGPALYVVRGAGDCRLSRPRFPTRMSRIGIPNDSQKGYSPPASDESEFEIELSMSLINAPIWSSSLATGSGVGGTTSVAAAVAAEADAEAPVETDGSPAASEGAETDEAIACGVAVDGALDEPRCAAGDGKAD